MGEKFGSCICLTSPCAAVHTRGTKSVLEQIPLKSLGRRSKCQGHWSLLHLQSHKIGTTDIWKDFDLKRKLTQLKQVLERVIDGTLANFELIRFSLNF